MLVLICGSPDLFYFIIKELTLCALNSMSVHTRVVEIFPKLMVIWGKSPDISKAIRIPDLGIIDICTEADSNQ